MRLLNDEHRSTMIAYMPCFMKNSLILSFWLALAIWFSSFSLQTENVCIHDVVCDCASSLTVIWISKKNKWIDLFIISSSRQRMKNKKESKNERKEFYKKKYMYKKKRKHQQIPTLCICIYSWVCYVFFFKLKKNINCWKLFIFLLS